MAKIIGFSGSPIRNSNTDRLLKHVLESTGLEYEFIKLSRLNIKPCIACKGCVKDDTCVVKDDFLELAEKVREADGIIIASYTPYGIIDGFTKALLERFFSLHHNGGQLKNKFLVSIISSIDVDAQNSAHRALVVESIIEKMMHVDALSITGSLPCNTCGRGNECETSTVKKLHGENAIAGSHNCIAVESQDVWKKAENTGIKLRNLIEKKEEYVQSELTKKVIARMQAIGRN